MKDSDNTCMNLFVAVALGGAAGACLRYAIVLLVGHENQGFPYATLMHTCGKPNSFSEPADAAAQTARLARSSPSIQVPAVLLLGTIFRYSGQPAPGFLPGRHLRRHHVHADPRWYPSANSNLPPTWRHHATPGTAAKNSLRHGRF